MRPRLAVVVVVSSLLLSASATAQASIEPARIAGATATSEEYKPGEVVVRYRDDTSARRHAQVRDAADTPRVRALGVDQTEVVAAPANTTPVQAAAELRRDPAVRYATPNWIVKSLGVPNDSRFDLQWGLRNTGLGVNAFAYAPSDGSDPTDALAGSDIGATSAWDLTTGSSAVKVAIMDTGIDFELPDLAPQQWTNPGEIAGNGKDDDGNGRVDDVHGYDFSGNDTDPFDEDGHGTHVAGIVGARGNDAVGVTGVSQQVSLIADRFLNADGNGTFDGSLKAIDYAGKVGADVANGSFGGADDAQAREMTRATIASHPDTLYVFAAGNGGADSEGDNVDAGDDDERNTDPCEVTAANSICVAATDQADRLAAFSNFGSKSVDLGAPGVDILSTWPRPVSFGFGPLESESIATAWPAVDRGGWGTTGEVPFDGVDGPGISDSPGGNYTPGTDNVALSRPIQIPAGATGCTVEALADVDLQSGASAGLSLVLGNGTSKSVFQLAGPRSIFGSGFLEVGDLGGQTVRVRAEVNSSANAVPDDGLDLGSLRLECDSTKGQLGSYQYLNGTSMATPQVAGAAALVLAKRPDLSVAQLRAALLDTGDRVDSLQGRTVTGRRLNVGAALASVSPPVVPGDGGGSTGGGSTGGGSTGGGSTGGGNLSSSSTRPLVTLSLGGLPAALQLDSSGKATIPVTGTAGASGQLSVRTASAVAAASGKRKKAKKSVLTLATKRFSIGRSGKAKVTVKVSGRALRAVRKAKRLTAKVTVVAGGRTVSRSVAVKAPKAKRHKKSKTKHR